MAELFPFDVSNIGSYFGSFSGSFIGDGSGLTGVSGSGGGSTNTGSLLTTASFVATSSNSNIVFTKGNGSTFNVDISKIVDGGTF
jgi:hypothetical protein